LEQCLADQAPRAAVCRAWMRNVGRDLEIDILLHPPDQSMRG